VTAELALDAHI